MRNLHPIFNDVSRETLEKLRTYEHLLKKWQKKINLISTGTKETIWLRHFADSAQLLPLLPPNHPTIIDVGSGAGFPGLILAIMGQKNVHLVESDQRKTAFLKEVLRETQTHASIHCQRIESFNPPQIDIITSRACADLAKLINILCPILQKNTICLFHKGENYIKELEGLKNWSYEHKIHQSQTHGTGVIIELSHLAKKEHG